MGAFFQWLWESLFRPGFWFQPVFYALHGWIATEMAIWLLFHPYEPKFIPGTRIQIPLTPGIFHRGRADLSRAIADTVTGTLITEEDIVRQTERLITEENLARAIDAIFDAVTRELQNTEQLRHIYRHGEDLLPGLLHHVVDGTIARLEAGHPDQVRMQDLLHALLDQILPNARLPYPQAQFVTDALFGTLITPANIRLLLVEGLTETTTARIERSITEAVGGWRGLAIRMMGIDKSLTRLREFLSTHPDAADAQILELLDRFEVREKLAERLAGFSYADLPPEAQADLRMYLAQLIREGLVDNRELLTQALADWSVKGSRLLVNRILQADPRSWLNEKRPELKREMARFAHRYLKRELGLIIARLMPAMNIGQMILEKLDQFSARQLEEIIMGICRRELRWLAFLGAFLGFWLGLVSNLIDYWLDGA